MIIYAVVDKKAGYVVSIFTSVSDESAVRSFIDLITSPADNIFSLHFDDFCLYKVGELSYSISCGTLFDSSAEVIFDGNTLSREVVTSKRLERINYLKNCTSDIEPTLTEGGDIVEFE